MCEFAKIVILFGSDCIVVDPQKNTVGVFNRVQAQQEFTEFQSSPVTAFASEDVDVFDEALGENSV